ncbi:MAG: hypothetical protein ACERKV_03335 [Clostridiaceae bacterium]
MDSNELFNKVEEINKFKEDLVLLPLNPEEQKYIELNLYPLVDIFSRLASSSQNLAITADQLSTSITTKAKRNKIQNTESLIYTINEDCEDLYKIIHQRLKLLK